MGKSEEEWSGKVWGRVRKSGKEQVREGKRKSGKD